MELPHAEDTQVLDPVEPLEVGERYPLYYHLLCLYCAGSRDFTDPQQVWGCEVGLHHPVFRMLVPLRRSLLLLRFHLQEHRFFGDFECSDCCIEQASNFTTSGV